MQLREMVERLDEVSFEQFCNAIVDHLVTRKVNVNRAFSDTHLYHKYVRRGVTVSETDRTLVSSKIVLDAVNQRIRGKQHQTSLSQMAIDNINYKQGDAEAEPEESSVWKKSVKSTDRMVRIAAQSKAYLARKSKTKPSTEPEASF